MLVDYELQLPNYIAQCINKDKPQMHCNGQCLLMKRIREKEKQENKKNMSSYEYSALFFHQESSKVLFDQASTDASLTPISNYQISYYFDPLSEIFRPPIYS